MLMSRTGPLAIAALAALAALPAATLWAQARGGAAAQAAAATGQIIFPIAQPCEPIDPPRRQAGRPSAAQAAAARRQPAVGTPEDSARAAQIAALRAAGGTGYDNQSVRGFAEPGDPGRNVLGGVCMTAQDSIVQQVVQRLDFDQFKNHLRGLAKFGDRWAGNPIGPGNAAAVAWIESQLKSWGYQTERLNYTFEGQPRSQVYATKYGTTVPGEMYFLGAHMDGRGGGHAINDDGSGTALVMEIARVLASPDVQTARSIRFALWNNEETGLNGARAYVEQRQMLQGTQAAGSGRFIEPKWLGIIQHDMLLYDHGNPPMAFQSFNADVNIEYQLNSMKAAESAQLGLLMINANRLFATEYPAQLSNSMSNTDTGAFQDIIPSVSVREGRRLYEMGRGSNPTYHQPTDIFASFTDQDYRLGFNAVQTTLGAVAKLTEVKIVPKTS